MAEHILVPVDGSAQSETSLSTAISLAQRLGSRVTVFYALPTEWAYAYATVPPFVDRSLLNQHTLKEIHALIGEQACHYLRELVEGQQKTEPDPNVVGIGWDCTESDHPYQAILNEAHRLGCDLIVMATHGRHGMEAVLLGSETQKVLTHSDLPVLVVPPTTERQSGR
jgi:nucleotide-binding universal stress UspA family protein